MNQDRILSLIRREKGFLIAGLILSIILMTVYALFFYTPMYQSNAGIYIRNISNENVLNSFGSSSPIKSESDYSNPLFNYQAILDSDQLSNHLYEKLKKDYPAELKLLEITNAQDWKGYFQDSLKSNIISSTDIINIQFDWPRRSSAQSVMTLLVDEYKNLNLEIQKSTVGIKGDQIDKQLEEITNDLAKTRNQIQVYRKANKVVDLATEGAELTRIRMGMEQQLQTIQSEIAFSQEKKAELKQLLNFDSVSDALDASSIGDDPYLVQLYKDLANAQRELDKLKARFENAYPDVQSALREVESVQSKIDQRIKEATGKVKMGRGVYNTVSNTLVQELAQAEVEQRSLIARKESLKEGLADFVQNELEIPEKSRYLDELQKEEQALKDAYQALKSSSIESHIKDSSLIDNLYVLNPASPGSLQKKDLLLNLFGILLFGLSIGSLIAYSKNVYQDKWNSIDEIEEATGKVVLGNLSWQRELDTYVDDSLEETSSIMREYKTVISSIKQRSYLEQAPVISFVSTKNERKHSVIVRNIALNMALSHNKVLLINTDFGESHENGHFEVTEPLGQYDIIAIVNQFNQNRSRNSQLQESEIDKMIDDATHNINIEDTDCALSYMTAELSVSRIYDVVGSYGFEELIRRLRPKYDFILLDTPSAPYDYVEVKTLMSKSDAVTVLSAVNTNRKELINMVRFADQNDIKLLGIIARV